MFKKLCILLSAVLLVVPATAQQGNGDGDNTSFAPKAGQWQISAMIGNSTMFDQDLDYVLPDYWNGNESWIEFDNAIGIDGGYKSTHKSDSPGDYVTLGIINNNSLVNLIGLQGKYFVTDHWDVNLMFSMNINMTPSKNYVEGEYENEYEFLPIMAQNYIEGELQNLWSAAVGSNYYFNTKNERINLYAGAVLGWQMGRVKTFLPYTGYTVTDEDFADSVTGTDDTGVGEDMPLEVYVPSVRAGQIWALRAGLVAGIEYSVAKGLVLGFEVQPAAYTYTHFQVAAMGQAKYQAGNHNVSFFATPNLKIGFRF